MSARRVEVEIMRCAMCNRDRAWTDGFPSRQYAQCWNCWAEEHMQREHAPPKRLVRRERRRLVKAYKAELRRNPNPQLLAAGSQVSDNKEPG